MNGDAPNDPTATPPGTAIDPAAVALLATEPTGRYDDEGLFARDIDGRLVRVRRSTAADFDTEVRLSIDGRAVTVKKAQPRRDSQGVIIRDADGNAIPRPTTIYDAAAEAFVLKAGDVNPIPTLCHREHMPPVGVCRLCMVEAVEETRRGVRSKLVPSCVQQVTDGMIVHTIRSEASPESAERVRKACGLLTELLVADHLPAPTPARSPGLDNRHATGPATIGDQPNRLGNELQSLAQRFGIDQSRFEPRDWSTQGGGSGDQPQVTAESKSRAAHKAPPPRLDLSNRMVAFDPQQCVLCARCVRGCDQIKKNHVIGKFGKGYDSHIGFDLDDPMGESSCVSCGECVISCPTGALEFQPTYLAASRDADDAIPEIDELMSIPLFSVLPPKFVQFNQNSFHIRKLAPGDVLCREGEHGATAFVIVNGRFEGRIRSAAKAETTRPEPAWRRLLGLARRDRSESSAVARINDLHGAKVDDGNRFEITADDVILGEMACLNNYPRSATVIASEPSTVVEIRRNVLYMMQRNEAAREFLDKVYRNRRLRGQIASLSIFNGLSDDDRAKAAEWLSQHVGLITVDPGQTIFRQGEIADALYINRLGFVRLSQQYGATERVLGYVSPGNYFGEIGLLTRLFGVERLIDDPSSTVIAGRRTASFAALDHVELIRIHANDFEELLRRFPQMTQPLLQTARNLLREDLSARRQQSSVEASEFIDQGLFLSQSLLVLDLEKCTRCDECTKACADTHGGVTRMIREGLRFDKYLVASSCRSCLDPYCLVGCPVDAIHRSGKSLEINIEDYCIGCGLCAQNCPYGNINMHGFAKTEPDPKTGKPRPVFQQLDGRQIPVIQQKATTCDLCRSIDGKPSCVYACPHDAAHRMSGEALLRIVERDGQAMLG
jgi:ferredoxin